MDTTFTVAEMTISDADTGFFATATVVVEKSGGEVRVGSASITNNSTTKPDRYYLRAEVLLRQRCTIELVEMANASTM